MPGNEDPQRTEYRARHHGGDRGARGRLASIERAWQRDAIQVVDGAGQLSSQNISPLLVLAMAEEHDTVPETERK